MLNWLRRKKPSETDRRGAGAPAAAASVTAAAPPLAPDRAAWQQRLDAARGDEGELLDFAQNAPLLDLKLAAVEALHSEAALKQAERAFRSHDRKVHQRARQRLGAVVARREARACAEAAIAAARALLATAPIAANRLAELDRDWTAIGPDLLDAAQRDAFAALRDDLDAALRAQDDARRAAQWTALAAPALAELEHACAAGKGAARIEALCAALEARLAACPSAVAAAQPAQAMRVALDSARLALQAAAEAARAAPPAAKTLPAPVAEVAPPAPSPRAPPRAEWLPAIEVSLRQAEAALAEGSTSELERLLLAIDEMLAPHRGPAPLPSRMHARLQALHAERQRLRDWQRWGGAVAREGLVDEAEALARATTAAQADPPAPRLNLKVHGESIRKLRARWKELDRTGAAAGQALWLRFDAALTLAHAPVAAQQAALKAAREDNLAARETLLAALEAAGAQEAQAPRAALQALQEFQLAWRKLGPLAHTVPSASAGALQQRLDAATSVIEAPLAAARAAAQREREALALRAEALAAQDEHDAPAQVRQLQTDWQQHARALPLTRAVEAALWARFRQACDAVAARREAALQARDAEAASGLAAREALLQRLAVLAQDATLAPPDLARALAQVDREWHGLYTPLPRAVAEGLEARYREAQGAGARSAEARQQALWQAQCDALAARLSLCEQREAGQGDDNARALAWQAAPAAPPAWERVLEARWSGAEPSPGDGADAVEAMLLHLEEALAIAPTAEQVQARRELKLRALKDTLEGRAKVQATSEPRRNAQWLALLLSRAGLPAPQRERLQALIGAMRGAPQQFDAG